MDLNTIKRSEKLYYIKNCGYFIGFLYKLCIGCRQGDPISPYFFVLAIGPFGYDEKNSTESMLMVMLSILDMPACGRYGFFFVEA